MCTWRWSILKPGHWKMTTRKAYNPARSRTGQNCKSESGYLIEVGSGMNTEGQGANEHIEIDIPIEVGGIDCMGIQFFDRTHTLMVSRTGGKISLERMVAPEQEVTIDAPPPAWRPMPEFWGRLKKSAKPTPISSNSLTRNPTFGISRSHRRATQGEQFHAYCWSAAAVRIMKLFTWIILSWNSWRRMGTFPAPASVVATHHYGESRRGRRKSWKMFRLRLLPPHSKTGAVSLGANCGSRRACAPRASARISSKLERRRVRDFPSPARGSISRAK